MRTLPRVVLSFFAAPVLLAAVPAEACGPYPFDTRFWYDDRPGVADHRAVRSQLGVFETQFDTAWIYVAWRQLAGPGMVESDRDQLVWLLSEEDEPEPEATGTWAEARSGCVTIALTSWPRR